ncbi:hypothetical protein [Endozoicomonas sp. SCSIO W0465]|uniref:hypothetical protein n=1 Tax=Endozoicomonas sp. SCSIO W0465 TaxID=2918516 RepID=UPI0020762604|nr:hypothetical protein [Endozoicomonas sp. SCSIO W0465]USE38440.1 hypothetical protein MJO57_09870 [Endozoicomonas sp. SCSIO W0465]
MLANIVEKWCLRGWYKNQKIPDLCGGAEQLQAFIKYFGKLPPDAAPDQLDSEAYLIKIKKNPLDINELDFRVCIKR